MPGIPLTYCLLHCLLMHPVHETISEVQWNAKTSRVEVAIRMDVLDEQWILKKVAKKGAKNDNGRLEYLRQRFRVSPLPKKGLNDATRYHWVGQQPDGAHVWWYFEIQPAAGKRPDWLENKLLFDRIGNYLHRVVFSSEVPKRSVDLSRGKPRAMFQPSNISPEMTPSKLNHTK